MEDNKTIYNYIGQTFATFGIIVFIFIILGIAIGDSESKYSSLFQLGNQGFSISTLLQLFILSVIISIAQISFFTDKWFKNLSMFIRNILFFGTIVLTMVIFALLFDWFRIDGIKAWIGFFLSFVVCTAVSVTFSILGQQSENKKMEQALDKIKNQRGKD